MTGPLQPQILGFGAHKAGTTWLHDNLVTNPGVWRPPLKEMHFFSHQMTGERWMFKGHRARLTERRERSLASGMPGKAAYLNRLLKAPMLSEDWYRKVYNRCPAGLQSVDITPAYALLDTASLRYMGSLLGDQFKAIYLIRDPAARVISAVKSHAAQTEYVGQTIDFWLDLITHSTNRKRSDYERTIRLLDAELGDRVLYLPFGQIKTDPVGLLRKVEVHCGLPDGQYHQAKKPKHVSPLVAIPEGLQEAAQILLKKQYDWLQKRFENTFLESI